MYIFSVFYRSHNVLAFHRQNSDKEDVVRDLQRKDNYVNNYTFGQRMLLTMDSLDNLDKMSIL